MATVKTSIVIISDTHCADLTTEGVPEAPNSLFKHPLPKADVLIHCGDLTHTGKIQQYERTLDMLKRIKAPVKLVIAGNHDLSLDEAFILSHWDALGDGRQQAASKEEAEHRHQQVRALWTSKTGRAIQEGVTFLDEGDHDIRLANGALLRVYANPYTPEFHDWGFAYRRDQDRLNEKSYTFRDCVNIAQRPLKSRTEKVYDIVITHGPARDILDPTFDKLPAGCPHLLRAIMRSRPLIHCFGHIHEGWGVKRITWTSEADELASKSTTRKEFVNTGWKQAIAASEHISSITDEDKQRHAVHVDLSAAGRPLQAGQETLFVNAAIMDVRYRPVNAPWLVEIDLPVA